MFLKDLLEVASAHTIKIKNRDTRRIVFEGAKDTPEYAAMLHDHAFHVVASVKPVSQGYGRNNTKTKLSIEIQTAPLV